jgi:hypothetical protein
MPPCGFCNATNRPKPKRALVCGGTTPVAKSLGYLHQLTCGMVVVQDQAEGF